MIGIAQIVFQTHLRALAQNGAHRYLIRKEILSTSTERPQILVKLSDEIYDTVALPRPYNLFYLLGNFYYDIYDRDLQTKFTPS